MDLMHLSDWLPTLYGRAGGDVDMLLDTDGYDMWPTLSEGKASPRQELVHNIDPTSWTSAIRYQQWKLLVNESKNMFFFLLLFKCSFDQNLVILNCSKRTQVPVCSKGGLDDAIYRINHYPDE